MSQTSPLLIIALDNSYDEQLPEIARKLNITDADFIQGTVAQAITHLNARPFSPEYLMIDIGQRGEEVLADLDLIAEHSEANVQVVIIGAINDVRFYRELIQRGVLEYFSYPLQATAVRDALYDNKQKARAKAGSADPKIGEVITFMSAASGDGSSTAAVNTAYALANEYKYPTVLVDMDYQFGLLARSLDVSAPFGIKEVFDHPERGIDNALINKMLVGYGQNLKIISAPNNLRLMPSIRPEAVRDLLGLLRSQFRYVIVDIPHIWTDWTAAALSNSTHNVMVAQLWLRSVTHATRLLNACQDIGVQKSSMMLGINRNGAKFKEGVSIKDFERVCNKKVDFFLGNDVKTVTAAENQGKTILEVGESQLQQQFRIFARQFLPADKPTDPLSIMPINAPVGKPKLLGFLKGP